MAQERANRAASAACIGRKGSSRPRTGAWLQHGAVRQCDRHGRRQRLLGRSLFLIGQENGPSNHPMLFEDIWICGASMLERRRLVARVPRLEAPRPTGSMSDDSYPEIAPPARVRDFWWEGTLVWLLVREKGGWV